MNYESTSRLSTVDEKGRRVWVYPSDFSGKYRSRRKWVSGILLIFFLVLPWLRVWGHPLLLLNIANGRFSVFGIQFWSHDAPMLLFVFGGAAVTLAFVTSVWGRIWCGWACPQTVFVDSVFRRVERWIEGDSVARRRLDAAPISSSKIAKKSLKWLSYLLISLILSHSFLAYFIGTDALAHMMKHSPFENLGSFIAMAVISGVVLFDFAWLREQFCTLICPYGRFQSVLMDERSLAITYDRGRGEPRREKLPLGQDQGDCINCRKCVQVCPTGIDIRNGLQLECIACTACVDACDAVMTKIGRPKGLIRYASGWGIGKGGYLKPLGYLSVLFILFSALTWTLIHREPVEFTLVRSIGAPYEEINRPNLEKEVVNHFKVDLLNQSFESVQIEVNSDSGPDSKSFQVVSANLPVMLSPGESRRIDLFVRFPVSKIPNGRGRFHLGLLANSMNWKQPYHKNLEVPLVGPLR